MENWEFLIQKEGVRAWFPLKPPIAQLESGRYRVVARSHRVNTEVEVRLTYQSQVQRLQKWIRHTNEKGLMPVFPYIHLQPGMWEISCSGNLMSELMGDSWKYTVQLQVLPVNSESEVDQQQVALQDEDPTTDIEDSSKVEDLPVNLKSEVDQQQAALLDEEPTDIEYSSKVDELGAVAVPIALSLDQQTYIALPGKSIALLGQVDLAEDNAQTASSQIEQRVNTYELVISLRDPENSQTIKEIRQLLSFSILPGPFEYSFDLPGECQTRLILGELQLFDATLPHSGSLMVTQEFTIAVGVHELIETISQQGNSAGTPFPEQLGPGKVKSKAESLKKESEVKPSVNLSFLNLAKDPQEHHQSNFQPASYRPIPDRIYEADPEKVKRKSPQLPPLGNMSVRPQVESKRKDVNREDMQRRKSISLPALKKPDRTIEYSRESEDGDRSVTYPLSLELQTLKFKAHFSERLKNLAEDPELLEVLEPNPFTNSSEGEKSNEEDELLAERKFVYEEITSEQDEFFAPTQGAIELSENPPVPKPELQVPEGELVAGESIEIVVKIPNLLSRIYVKLWVVDPQTRTILEQPRWLIDFQDRIDRETNTNLLVPFGCIEIQIEAICVEVDTQLESHKVTVNRMVVPPNLPELRREN